MSNKFYIKLFRINTLKIKKIAIGLPFLSFRKYGSKFSINVLILQKIIEHYKKLSIKKKLNKDRQHIIKKFKQGKQIRICLVTERPGTWIFDYLYPLLKKNPQFEVESLVMPDPFRGLETQIKFQEEAY